MTETAAVVSIIAGGASVVVAFVNRRFYWRKGWMSGDKAAPRWVGRLLFGLIGALLILVGIRFFALGY